MRTSVCAILYARDLLSILNTILSLLLYYILLLPPTPKAIDLAEVVVIYGQIVNVIRL